MGNDKQFKQQYGSMAARSKFCLVTMGDGWSARSEFAILHGEAPAVTSQMTSPWPQPKLKRPHTVRAQAASPC